jgi:hypothetical protein
MENLHTEVLSTVLKTVSSSRVLSGMQNTSFPKVLKYIEVAREQKEKASSMSQQF